MKTAILIICIALIVAWITNLICLLGYIKKNRESKVEMIAKSVMLMVHIMFIIPIIILTLIITLGYI